MTDLFNTKDLLTVATVDQAEINTKGYFGDNLSNLIEKVRQGKVETLTDVMPNEAYCFGVNEDSYYIFFLPEDKVKEKEPTYRPFNCLDELFNFFFPEIIKDNFCDQIDNEIIRYKKAELLLGKKITLREKQGAYTNVVIIQSVDFYGDSDAGEDIRINNNPLNFMFEAYKILIDGEFVPFGVKE